MNEEVTRTRIIRNNKIEEKFPINYDAIQELAENAEQLFDIIFSPQWSRFKAGESKYEYVKFVAFEEVLFKFLLVLYLTFYMRICLKKLKYSF